MRITIIATGSRGDVQPYVALGQGLRRAGHEVCLVTTADFAALATAHGVPVRSVGLAVQDALRDPAVRAAIEGGGLLASFRHMTRLAREAAAVLMREGLEAARGTDVLLAGFGGLLVAASLAEALGVPFIPAYNVPVTPTGAFPGALLPGLSLPLPGLGPLARRLSHWLSWQALWQMARAGADDARREVLGLRPVPRLGPATPSAARGAPLLYGISPAVLPRPADWGAHVHMTGFWFLDAPADWAPPPALEAFLARGPAPVSIGFGSMSSTQPEALMRIVLEAVAVHGRRAVVHAGWAGLHSAARWDDVLLVDAVPHAWLFARVSAVVHHGGAGTTAAALRAGVPSVVVPFHGDQPFWGRLVHARGVGTRPIPRQRLTASRLAAAIEEALTDAPLRARAAHTGERVRQEDGVAAAVALIGRLGR